MSDKLTHPYTTSGLFRQTMQQLREAGRVPEELLEYDLADSEAVEIRNYECDVVGVIKYGSSEGIYVSLYLDGNIGYGWKNLGGKTALGTLKTLDTSDDAFRQMAVLMADFQIAATRFINANLDDFTWVGYDIDYYVEGETEQSYGTTNKGIKSFKEATEEAQRTMKRFPQYVKAVITHNADRKTMTVYRDDK